MLIEFYINFPFRGRGLTSQQTLDGGCLFFWQCTAESRAESTRESADIEFYFYGYMYVSVQMASILNLATSSLNL